MKSSLLDQNSKFALNPTNLKGIQRAQFDLSSTVKTSFNVGQLIPFDVIEILPGDTFDLRTNVLARLQTLITPMMDDLYLDMWYFFVPNRLVWDNWQAFMGENTQSAWYSSQTFQVPQLNIPQTTVPKTGDVIDYMGIPVQQGRGYSVNALPIRAYTLIYNEWFRDQNLQDPVLLVTDDTPLTYEGGGDARVGGKPFNVNKYHDYFTSCLPAPQKGPDVTIPMMSDTNIPIKTLDTFYTPTDGVPMYYSQVMSGAPDLDTGFYNLNVQKFEGNKNLPVGVDPDSTVTAGGRSLAPSNLYATIEGLPVATINQLRLAFATQKLYEKDARGGTRYVEILRSHFGVISPDARLQRPELLSYNHIPINIQQVVQNSETANTPQGNVAAFSVTGNTDGSFIKSFVEHGYIIGLCAARYNHTYQQGLHRLWSRKNRFDFYWPVFSNIGEQPVLNKEIYLTGSGGGDKSDDEVFGYQEAWAEYRYRPARVSGEMRSDIDNSLDVWHLADDYKALPALSDEWIQEDATNVNRVIAVSDQVANQIFMDINIQIKATRPMPMYSIPGLIDHF